MNMDIKERLKTLNIDSLYQTSLDEDLAKSWQRKKSIKLFLAQEIRNILQEIYEPLGMWGQNPDTKDAIDLGVIIDGKWSPLMQGDTHYSGHSLIFNKCNRYIVNKFRKEGLVQFEIDGTIFSYKEQIVFGFEDTEEETIEKIKKILKIVRYKKNEIFLFGCEMYNTLIGLYNRTMNKGDEAQRFYEDDIYYFFPDMKSYVSTKGRGDYKDRKEGIDIWKIHKDGSKTTDQIKSVCNLERKNNGWFVNVAMSENSKCTYYVFVCLKSRIIVFNNDKNKMIFEDGGVFFPDELIHEEKKYE